MADAQAVVIELALFVLGCAGCALASWRAAMRARAARVVREAEERARALISEAERTLAHTRAVQNRALRIAARLIVAAGAVRRTPKP